MPPRLACPRTLAVSALAVAASAGAWGAPPPFGALARALVAAAGPLHDGELWRLLTGPLVHVTPGHLLRDLAVFLVVGALYEPVLGRRFVPLLALALAVPTAAVFAAQPALGAYYGLSGACNALFVAALLTEWRRAGCLRPPWWVLALAVAHGAKTAWELTTGTLLFPLDLGARVEPAPVAHGVGSLVGFLVLVPTRSDTARRSPRRTAPAPPAA